MYAGAIRTFSFIAIPISIIVVTYHAPSLELSFDGVKRLLGVPWVNMKTFDSIVTSSTEKDRKNGRDMKKTMPPAPGYANHTDHVVEHHEYAKGVATEPLRKRQRLRNHCARFWIFWLIGIIVVNAILLPIL